MLEAVHAHTRLTSAHIRRLFFRRPGGGLASPQAANVRLRKLVALGLLEPIVVTGRHGAGPYAYALAPRGRALLQRLAVGPRRGAPGPVWHYLGIADFRVALQGALERRHGELTEWLGEPALRGLLRGRTGWPVPDAVVHWRLAAREGTFMLEWDRGSESLAVVAAKLPRYAAYWRTRGYRELLPGLGLRPRLAIVLDSKERKERMTRWIPEKQRQLGLATILVADDASATKTPLGPVWWRSDTGVEGYLAE